MLVSTFVHESEKIFLSLAVLQSVVSWSYVNGGREHNHTRRAKAADYLARTPDEQSTAVTNPPF